MNYRLAYLFGFGSGAAPFALYKLMESPPAGDLPLGVAISVAVVATSFLFVTIVSWIAAIIILIFGGEAP